jgi:tetratricopeptide (TPR) repeat protein
LFRLKKYYEALECYDKAIKINPNAANVIKNRENIINHINNLEKKSFFGSILEKLCIC